MEHPNLVDRGLLTGLVLVSRNASLLVAAPERQWINECKQGAGPKPHVGLRLKLMAGWCPDSSQAQSTNKPVTRRGSDIAHRDRDSCSGAGPAAASIRNSTRAIPAELLACTVVIRICHACPSSKTSRNARSGDSEVRPWDWTICGPSLWYCQEGYLSRVMGQKPTLSSPDLCARSISEDTASALSTRIWTSAPFGREAGFAGQSGLSPYLLRYA